MLSQFRYKLVVLIVWQNWERSALLTILRVRIRSMVERGLSFIRLECWLEVWGHRTRCHCGHFRNRVSHGWPIRDWVSINLQGVFPLLKIRHKPLVVTEFSIARCERYLIVELLLRSALVKEDLFINEFQDSNAHVQLDLIVFSRCLLDSNDDLLQNIDDGGFWSFGCFRNWLIIEFYWLSHDTELSPFILADHR